MEKPEFVAVDLATSILIPESSVLRPRKASFRCEEIDFLHQKFKIMAVSLIFDDLAID